MFVTEELNVILRILKDKHPSESIKEQLLQEYVNLEATILRGKVLRDFASKKVNYIVQSEIQENDVNLAYLFAPFILSNLNQSVIYTTPQSKPVLTVLKKYYQADYKVNLKIEHIIDCLNLYMDLVESDLNEEDFLFRSLIKAICRTDISTVFLITSLELDLDIIHDLQDFLKIRIHVIHSAKNHHQMRGNLLNMRKLLFKNKDEFHQEVCECFSAMNANVISLIDTCTHKQVRHLIDDMFYSEHIFEKLSVYAEYIQTRIQNR